MAARLPRLGTWHAVLAAILLAYAYLAVGYARATPRWNNPDEPAHFTYIRHVAQTGRLPVLEPGDWDAEHLERLKTDWFPTDEIDAIRYESHQPPLYYLAGAVIQRLTGDLPIERQVSALRALSTLFGAVTVLAAFVVAREAVPARPELAVLASALVAFVPMHTAMSAAINNDSLANALAGGTLATLYVGWRRGFGARGALALGVLLGLLILTKLTLYVYVPLALAVLFLRERCPGSTQTLAPADVSVGASASAAARAFAGASPRVALRRALMAGSIALLMAAPWLLRNVAVYGPTDPLGLGRHDTVVVGQPRWADFEPPAGLSSQDFFFRILFRSFWGMFGWMGVILDDGFYLLYLGLTLLALLGLVLPPTGRGVVRAPWLLAAAVVLVFGEVASYNLVFVQPQGRYLFPALVPLAVVLSAGWWRLASTAASRNRLGVLPAGLLAAALGWSFGEAHGALRAAQLWADETLVWTAVLAGLAVVLAPRAVRMRLPIVLVGLTVVALGLLDDAALVRFVAPAFPLR